MIEADTIDPVGRTDPSGGARGARPGGTIPLSYDKAGAVLALFDVLVITLLAVVCGVAYGAVAHKSADLSVYLGIGLGTALIFALAMQAQRLYRPSRILQGAAQTRGALVTFVVVFGLLIALAFLLKVSADLSRGIIAVFFASVVLALPLTRIAAGRALRALIASERLVGHHRVVLFGEADQMTATDIASRLRRHGYNVVERIAFTLSARPGRAMASALERLKTYVGENRVDEIHLVCRSGDQRTIEEIVDSLRSVPLPVRLVVDPHLSALLSRPIVDLGAAHVIEMQRAPLTGAQQACKRALDVALSIAGLCALAPLLLLVAAAIKLDSPGPVLFRQRRAGFSGRRFTIYKFRTMRSLDDGAVVRQATRDDPRVTHVGRWLRRTSIDELPQLVNVLQGEMSLVGPRPHALSHDSDYTRRIATYALRQHMKPGITGWAQVNGSRGETATLDLMERRIRYDLWYIAHWSFWLDLTIIARTITQAVKPPKYVY